MTNEEWKKMIRYEQGMIFLNSRRGIILNIINDLGLIALFIYCLTRNIEKKQTGFMFLSIFFIGFGLFGLIKTFIKIKNLKKPVA